MNIKKAFSLIISAAVCSAALALSAFAENDDIPETDDYELEAEEVSVYDEIHRGEGYYVCHISYRGGVPDIYDENASADYSLVGEIGGNLKEGETRESVVTETIEDIRNSFVTIGVNPDDYPFDVYAYFYDDYDLTPEEFLDFISEDILRRDWERDRPAEIPDAPNPPMGTALPYGAAALAALSAVCITAANKKSL